MQASDEILNFSTKKNSKIKESNRGCIKTIKVEKKQKKMKKKDKVLKHVHIRSSSL